MTSPLDPELVAEVAVAALHRAKELDEPVIAAVGGLVAPDTADVTDDWTAAERAFVWRSPWLGVELTAAGALVELTGAGPDRLHQVQARWDEVRGTAVVAGPNGHGMRLVGGCAFRPGGGAATVLPPAMWWVPQALRLRRAGQDDEVWHLARATPDDDVAAVAEQLLHPVIPVARDGEAPERDAAEVAEIPYAGAWRQLVDEAVAAIHAGEFDKVVIARRLRVLADRDFDIAAAVGHLRGHDPQTAVYALRLPGGWFLGATPELLLHGDGGTITTIALAGSDARGWDDAHDRQLARQLLESPKNRHEHALVVAALREFLARHCAEMWADDGPQVARFATIQHLRTRLGGRLRAPEAEGLLDLAARLHPTPALGGFPRDAALAWLDGHEHIGREWYAAPVGWVDSTGDGELAVAIRCALVDHRTADLFAGCGIVADSVPAAEVRESVIKLRAMLAALGLPPAELLEVT
jgi:isochorismate synthase